MKTRIKIVASLLFAIYVTGCGVTQDNVLGVTSSCNNIDIKELSLQNFISEDCKKAIENLLPSPENNLQDRLLALGQNIGTQRELFLLASSTISNSSITIEATTNGEKSTLNPNDYTIGKLSDLYNGTPLLSISSILDYSSSMSDSDIDDSVTIFSDIFSIFTTPLLESEIRLFSEFVYPKLTFNSDKDTLLANIAKDESIERDSTALYDAIGTGLEALASRSTPIKVMIISTDGMENNSVTYTNKQTLYNLAKSNNIPVVIIGTLLSDLDFMKELASETNGIFIYNKTILKVKEDAKLFIEMLKNIQVITITKSFATGSTFKVTADNKSVSF